MLVFHSYYIQHGTLLEVKIGASRNLRLQLVVLGTLRMHLYNYWIETYAMLYDCYSHNKKRLKKNSLLVMYKRALILPLRSTKARYLSLP